MNPRFPIFIVSKGRWESRMSARYLDAMGVGYRVIVEQSELLDYAAVIDPAKLIVLDPAYQRDYDACMELRDGESRGSGPARNFAWDTAEREGARWHWTIDDNIRGWYRLHGNLKVPMADGTGFRAMEDFCDRFENVAMGGPNYFMFAPTRARLNPITLNTRIYSCNLIRTDLPFRWRARYNEDTDLSLRLLKAGWTTVLFNAFLQDKMNTQTMKGGNTDVLYAAGTLAKSRMIADLHPDVARVVTRFGRDHHYVDYTPFADQLPRLKPGVAIPDEPDNYGLVLEELLDGEWVERGERPTWAWAK